MSYVVAIPSYQRARMLMEKTLTMLQEGHVSRSHIYIFVANETEEKEYKSIIPKTMYNKIVIGVKGINEQRKFISRHFPNGKKIVSIDDDVANLLQIENGKFHPLTNVHEFFTKAFKDLKSNGLYLWGVFPTPNEFYCKDQKPMTINLKFIIATVFGCINRHDMILSSHIEEKEDVENTIKHYLRDGGVLRYNHISFKTKFKNPQGGLGGFEKRLAANKEAAEYMVKHYPLYASIKVRKNGMYEVVLRDRSGKAKK